MFALWKDATATMSNISDAALAELTKTYGTAPSPEDIFAYVAALLAHPTYISTFKDGPDPAWPARAADRRARRYSTRRPSWAGR